MGNKPGVSIMCFSENNGGMELDAIKLAKLLHDKCEVVFLCKDKSFIHKKLTDQTRIDYVPVKFSSRTFSISMFVNVRRVLRDKKINNVVFFGASELKTLYFAFLGFNINVVVRHGTTKTHRKRWFLHKLIYSCVSYHIALSGHLLKNVKYIIPHNPSAKYRIIYPSFNIVGNQHSLNSNSKLRITHVGRIVEPKGQLDALRACELLYDSGIDFELNLVGSLEKDEFSNKIKAYIKSSPFAGQINLTGFMDNPQSILECSDLFLFPSFGEGMPNSFIEALHFGIPCLAYDNTVFPEYSEMGFYVTLAEHRNQIDLAAKLLSMAKNIEKEKQASLINMELARKYFDINRELDNWKEILV